MTEKEFKPFFQPDYSDAVIARAYQEEGAGLEVIRRVVHAELYPKTRILADNWEYNRHSGAEREATEHAFELAESGFDLVIWVSPESDIYEEGRLNVMPPVKNGERLAFDPWGIPLRLNREESVELGERLLAAGGLSMDPIDDPESLRRQPVGFKLAEGQKWLVKCRELIPEMDDIWDEIGKGEVDKNMRLIMENVRQAKIKAGGNGVVLEMVMLREFGRRLNVAGDHGGSWLSMLENKGIYNYTVEKVGGEVYVEKVKVSGKWVCPLCGAEVGEGATVCAICGAKMK
jgi:hypothetical protein